jgi:threonylcarbamoyladenosine tRNA methylthiotransferase MtaB
MARKYTMAQFYTLVKYIRLKSPLCSITTDYIVGFPTETIKNFDDSIKELKKLALADIHIFPFSSHKGTKASLLKNIVSDTEKKRRYMIIDALNKKNMAIYLNKFIDKTVDVLFERSSKLNLQYGHSQYFFSVNVRTKKILTNKMLKVKITSVKDNEIFGKLV